MLLRNYFSVAFRKPIYVQLTLAVIYFMYCKIYNYYFIYPICRILNSMEVTIFFSPLYEYLFFSSAHLLPEVGKFMTKQGTIFSVLLKAYDMVL